MIKAPWLWSLEDQRPNSLQMLEHHQAICFLPHHQYLLEIFLKKIHSEFFKLYFLLRQVNADGSEVIIARCVFDSHLLRHLFCRETAEQVVGSVNVNTARPILVSICRCASFRWPWMKDVCLPARFALLVSLLCEIVQKCFTCPVWKETFLLWKLFCSGVVNWHLRDIYRKRCLGIFICIIWRSFRGFGSCAKHPPCLSDSALPGRLRGRDGRDDSHIWK